MTANYKLSTSNVLISLVFILGVASFFDLNSREIVYVNVIFELFLLLIFSILILKLSISKHALLFSVLIFLYITYSFSQFLIYEQTGKLTDYLLMYKVFIYLLLLSFFVEKQYLNQNFLRNLFNVLVFLFLTKYILMKILGYGYQGRPVLFTENNFELIMLLILYIGVYSREKGAKKGDLIFLTIIFVLSGSRSATGAFFIMLYFIDFGNSNKHKMIKLFFLVVGMMGLAFIFLQRIGNGSVEDIDRVRFIIYFFNEISSWNFFNYLFGAPFMTPMSPETSKALSYYQLLYSDHDKLLTYSVVLHSFVLRAIFDHGLVGFWFIFYTTWKFLEFSGYKRKERLSIILILIATGLSVSSLNSVFVAFSLGLIMITKWSNITNKGDIYAK